MNPSNYRYTKDHVWISLQGMVATIGITDYAQAQLGNVVFVQLPKAGAQVRRGEAFGSVESVKAVNDLPAPITGEVTRANAALANSPDLVNQDPYGAAWFLEIRITNPAEATELMDANAYAKYVGELAK